MPEPKLNPWPADLWGQDTPPAKLLASICGEIEEMTSGGFNFAEGPLVVIDSSPPAQYDVDEVVEYICSSLRVLWDVPQAK